MDDKSVLAIADKAASEVGSQTADVTEAISAAVTAAAVAATTEAALVDRTPVKTDDAVAPGSNLSSSSMGQMSNPAKYSDRYEFSTNENGFKRTFPEKLMEILDQPDVQDCMMWTPDGDSFRITSVNKCTSEVLPRFFKQTKFPSFVRKLNRWGFKQVRSINNVLI